MRLTHILCSIIMMGVLALSIPQSVDATEEYLTLNYDDTTNAINVNYHYMFYPCVITIFEGYDLPSGEYVMRAGTIIFSPEPAISSEEPSPVSCTGTFELDGDVFFPDATFLNFEMGVYAYNTASKSSEIEPLGFERLFLDEINPIESDPTILTVPEQPYELGASSNNPNEITVHWIPNGDGGSPIYGYLVEYSVVDSGDWQLRLAVPPATSTIIYGLTADVWYEFRITTVNVIGSSEPSNDDLQVKVMKP